MQLLGQMVRLKGAPCNVTVHAGAPLHATSVLGVQTLEKKEKGAEVQPNVLPSWAVPAIEGVPEAIQAAAQATTKAVKDAKDAVQSAVTAVTSPFPEKVLLCGISSAVQMAACSRLLMSLAWIGRAGFCLGRAR